MKDDKFKERRLKDLAELYSESEVCLILNQTVRELKTERGKQESYILELQEQISVLKSMNEQQNITIENLTAGEGLDLIRKQKQQILIDNRIAELDKRCKNMAITNKRLRSINNDLVSQLYSLKKEKKP